MGFTSKGLPPLYRFMKKIIKLLLLTCFLTSCDSSDSKEEIIDEAKLHETEVLLKKALFSIRFGMATNMRALMHEEITDEERNRLEQSLVFSLDALISISKKMGESDSLSRKELLIDSSPYIDYLLKLENIGDPSWETLNEGEGKGQMEQMNRKKLKDYQSWVNEVIG